MRRGLLALCLAAAWLLALVATAWAAGPEPVEPSFMHGGLCNEFEFLIDAGLSEAGGQSRATLVEVGRVLHTKGSCYRDENWLGGFGLAAFIAEQEPGHCIRSWHCRAYYLTNTIDPQLRERAAQAAWIVLTETPVRRYHFDGATAPRWAWWDSPAACPAGDFVSGQMRIC